MSRHRAVAVLVVATRAAARPLALLWGLVVDDPVLAAGVAGSLLAAYLLSRDAVLGASQVVGWLLLAGCALALTVSLARATARR